MINQLLKPVARYIPENNRLERIWLIAKTDFLKRYYGSALGLIWALINPLSKLLLYFFVFTVVFKSQTEDFILFLFLGLVIWMFFTEATKDAISIFQKKRYILENIQINTLDIYYASLLSGFFAFLFNLTIFFVFSLFYDSHYTLTILLFPILLLNLGIFILAAQLILSVMFIKIRDVKHIYDIIILFMFWLSGVLFEIDPTTSWKTETLNYLTPVIGIITNSRAVVIYGKEINMHLFIYDWVYAIVLLLIAYFIFKRSSRHALEYL